MFYKKKFIIYIKMSECNSIKCADLTYYQKTWEVILNRAKDYEKDKKRLREQARYKYRTLSEEEKNKKRE